MLYTEKKDIAYYLGDDFVAPRVFCFHPIHLFLNSENIGRYEKAHLYIKDYGKLKECKNRTVYGTRDLFSDLVKQAKKGKYDFVQIKEGNWRKEICG